MSNVFIALSWGTVLVLAAVGVAIWAELRWRWRVKRTSRLYTELQASVRELLADMHRESEVLRKAKAAPVAVAADDDDDDLEGPWIEGSWLHFDGKRYREDDRIKITGKSSSPGGQAFSDLECVIATVSKTDPEAIKVWYQDKDGTCKAWFPIDQIAAMEMIEQSEFNAPAVSPESPKPAVKRMDIRINEDRTIVVDLQERYVQGDMIKVTGSIRKTLASNSERDREVELVCMIEKVSPAYPPSFIVRTLESGPGETLQFFLRDVDRIDAADVPATIYAVTQETCPKCAQTSERNYTKRAGDRYWLVSCQNCCHYWHELAPVSCAADVRKKTVSARCPSGNLGGHAYTEPQDSCPECGSENLTANDHPTARVQGLVPAACENCAAYWYEPPVPLSER